MNPIVSNKEALDVQSQECTSLINESKDVYIAKMSANLDNPKNVPKTYWSAINKFLSNKKISIIPPIHVNGELVSDFKRKANMFHNLIVSLWTPIKNGSKLPNFSYKTEKRLESIYLNDHDILLIIKYLNTNKAHGCYQLSIRIIKVCGNSISLPSNLIFKSTINEGVFQEGWEKSNVVPICKNNQKIPLRTISL